MTFKKLLAPNFAILIVLSIFWLAGVENVVPGDDDHQKNIKKYIQTQRRIVDNYVDKVDINKLYKSSIRGLVTNMSDSTASLEGTPIDTVFSDLSIDNLSKSVDKFEQAYLYMSNNYPDENMTARTEDAIEGMFKGLDPHSIYIEPKISENIDDSFSGKFQGIGVQFNVIQDTITVITAIAGGPSDQLGIRSGDRIIKIDGESAIGFDNEDVRNNLRGPKGSEVDVTVKRPNVKQNLNFTITRDDIPLYSIGASYMLDEQTGYIKMDKFIQTTHEEFMTAMKELQDDGMERLVLDLRGNPGGYLHQAIAITEEFFPKGTKIVSTKSRHTRFTSAYYSRRDGYFKDKPLMILVNEGSASASEIVSGAIQDHDRGWIVGRRTFGKGLVQQQYELVDSSKIRVTISKYYTPSGRLIQKPYNKKGGEEYAYEIYQRENDAKGDVMEFISHVPDSLKYSTDAGRTVYGGGGIVPDHVVQPDSSNAILMTNFMLRNQVGFNFVRDFLDNQGKEFRKQWEDFNAFRRDFEWSNEDMQNVFDRLQDKNLAISDTLSEPEFKSDTLFVPDGHLDEFEKRARGYIKAELARQVWGFKKYYPIRNELDSTIKEAMDMWDEVAKLQEYASNHTKTMNTTN
jgi:carboxyl-terminal processing protease